MKFSKVHIEISNVCNLQCSFCPEVVRGKRLMSVELFTQIISQVAPIAEQVAFHLMGDPLVHPRLAEFSEICHTYGVPIFLVTNGVLLKDARAQLLLHPAYAQVNFSLHSFADNFPEKDPTSYLERIFAYTERALRERPDLYINYRLWNLEHPTGGAANRDVLERIARRFSVSVPDVVDVRRRKSHRLTGRLYLHFDTEFIWPSPALPVLGKSGTCHGMTSHFGILVDGTVVPCCLDKEGTIALGRIPEQPLHDILHSPRAQALIAGFRNRRLVEDLCQRCQYITRFSNQSPKL